MIPCRCSARSCGHRRNFKKHPDTYFRLPKCACGRAKWTVDAYRQRMRGKENRLCHCGHVTSSKGMPIHPHRWVCKGCFNREELLLNMAAKGHGGKQLDECIF